MDKKELNALVQGIVAEVALAHDLEEAEARTFVGVALKRNRDSLLQCIVLPQLNLGPQK